MDVRIYPSTLNGSTEAVSSRSMAMRYLIAAALSENKTDIYLKNETEDISVVVDCLNLLGASVRRNGSVYAVYPICFDEVPSSIYNVKESLPALRFLMPVLCALNDSGTIFAEGKLAKKPLADDLSFLKGVRMTENRLPVSFKGKLTVGEYFLSEETSSQLVGGLLMALPLLDGDSKIIIDGKQKKQFELLMRITVKVMAEFGVKVEVDGNVYSVKGNQKYHSPEKVHVEGDYASSAYFLAAKAVGSNLQVTNLLADSIQEEKCILDFLQTLSLDGDCIIDIDGKTDLTYALTVASCIKKHKTVLKNAVGKTEKSKRKAEYFIDSLVRMGGKIKLDGEDILIEGTEGFKGGVMLDANGDAKMAAAYVISGVAIKEPIILLSADSAAKLHPTLINEFIRMGGKCTVV